MDPLRPQPYVVLPSANIPVSIHSALNDFTSVIQDGDTDSASIKFSVPTSTNGTFVFIFAAARSGYNSVSESLYSDGGAWTGGAGGAGNPALPTTGATTGITVRLNNTLLARSQRPAGPRTEVSVIMTGFTLELISNNSSLLNRKGKLIAGWTYNVTADLKTFSVLNKEPESQTYDTTCIGRQAFTLMRKTSANVVNNSVAGDDQLFTNENAGGYYYVLGKGLDPDDELSFRLNTSFFYFGSEVSPTTKVIFDSYNYNCVGTCVSDFLGNAVSLPTDRKKELMKDVIKGSMSLASAAFPIVGKFMPYAKMAYQMFTKWSE
jgi:hypothetical protein